MRFIDFFDGQSSTTGPNIFFTEIGKLANYADDAAYVAAKASAADESDIYYRTTDDKIRYYDGVQWRSLGGGGSGVLADLYDPESTTLPTGTAVTIDGVVGVDGDVVLFSNLSSDSDRLYLLGGVGVAISWTAQASYSEGLDPSDGETVRFRKGNAFAESLAYFDGTDFKVNDYVRYFDGSNYWEQSSLKTVSLTAATTDDIFTVNVSGSENWIINYSISRGSAVETGQFLITSDGTNVGYSRHAANISDVDTTLLADISGSNIRFRYTTGAGSAGEIKFHYKRWSSSVGGPGGVPSYSGATTTISAAGNLSEVQYHGAGGNLAADSSFKWDDTNKQLNLNGFKIEELKGALTLNDNQVAPATIVTIDGSISKYHIIEYSIERSTENRVGRLLVCHNGTVASLTDDEADTGGAGIGNTAIVFSTTYSGGNILVQYVTNSTGNTGAFKYSIRKWI